MLCEFKVGTSQFTRFLPTPPPSLSLTRRLLYPPLADGIPVYVLRQRVTPYFCLSRLMLWVIIAFRRRTEQLCRVFQSKPFSCQERLSHPRCPRNFCWACFAVFLCVGFCFIGKPASHRLHRPNTGRDRAPLQPSGGLLAAEPAYR